MQLDRFNCEMYLIALFTVMPTSTQNVLAITLTHTTRACALLTRGFLGLVYQVITMMFVY